MLHKNTVFGYIEVSKPIGSQNVSVGGVLGFENYSTRFNPRVPEFFITRGRGFVDVSIGKQT